MNAGLWISMNTTLHLGEIVISHLLRRGLRNQSSCSSVQQPSYKPCALLVKVANFLYHHATVIRSFSMLLSTTAESMHVDIGSMRMTSATPAMYACQLSWSRAQRVCRLLPCHRVRPQTSKQFGLEPRNSLVLNSPGLMSEMPFCDVCL